MFRNYSAEIFNSKSFEKDLKGAGDGAVAGDNEVLGGLETMPKPKPKRRVRSTKEYVDALLSDKGMKRLWEDMPQKIALKGKKNEMRDLKTILRYYREWMFALAPEVRFEEGVKRIEAFGSTVRVKAALREYRMKNMREWQKKLGLQMDDDDDEPNEDSSNHDKQANVNAGGGDENLEAGKNGFVGDFGEKTDVDPVDVDMDMMKAAMGEVKDLEDTKKVGDENPPDGENDIMELVKKQKEDIVDVSAVTNDEMELMREFGF